MAARFQTVLRKARFQVTGYSAQTMSTIAQRWLEGSIKPRIQAGQTIYDSPAPALSKTYAKFKARKYPPPIRNWIRTGRTMRSLRVLSASPNKAVIGFTDPETNRRAALNQRRSRQFGASEKDKGALGPLFAQQESPIKAVQVAA